MFYYFKRFVVTGIKLTPGLMTIFSETTLAHLWKWSVYKGLFLCASKGISKGGVLEIHNLSILRLQLYLRSSLVY